jgi:hypothetical protein
MAHTVVHSNSSVEKLLSLRNQGYELAQEGYVMWLSYVWCI